MKLAFVMLSCRHCLAAFSFRIPAKEISIIDISMCVLENSFALFESIDKISFVDCSVLESFLSVAVWQIVQPLSLINNLSSSEYEHSFAICSLISDTSLVKRPIRDDWETLTMFHYSIFELSVEVCAVWVLDTSLSVLDPIVPETLIISIWLDEQIHRLLPYFRLYRYVRVWSTELRISLQCFFDIIWKGWHLVHWYGHSIWT